jgi:hypothetical protein
VYRPHTEYGFGGGINRRGVDPRFLDRARCLAAWSHWGSRSVPDDLKVTLRREFTAIHKDVEGHAILETADISRFGEISDEDYKPILEMEHVASAVEW